MTALALSSAGGQELLPQAKSLEKTAYRLRLELLAARVRAGELPLPVTIKSREQAYVWLSWARANAHTPGCLCHRCPVARRLMGGQSWEPTV